MHVRWAAILLGLHHPYGGDPLKRISILLVPCWLLVVAGVRERPGRSADASERRAERPPPSRPRPSEPSEDADEPSAHPVVRPERRPRARRPLPRHGRRRCRSQVQSFRGDAFMAGRRHRSVVQAFLDSVGAELEDVSVAFGGAMPARTSLSVGAFRVARRDRGRTSSASSSPPARSRATSTGLDGDVDRRQGRLDGGRRQRRRLLGVHLHRRTTRSTS